MNLNLPYRVLLLLTIGVAGVAVLYNLMLRDSFPVFIRYSLPGLEAPADEPGAPAEEGQIQGNWTVDDGPGTLEEEGLEPEEAFSVTFPLDVNAATVDELKYIPNVGDVMAGRIVQYREHIGGYTDLEQLREIKGVGDRTYETLWTYLYIPGEGQITQEGGVEE